MLHLASPLMAAVRGSCRLATAPPGAAAPLQLHQGLLQRPPGRTRVELVTAKW